MIWRTAIHCAALFTVAAIANSQQVRQGALGFVLDKGTARVRPLWGVPGAARVGDPIDLGGDVSAIAASPNQDYVVALIGGAANIWTRETATLQSIPGIPAGAARVVLSPEGGSAVFYYPDAGRIHVVTGLPSAPVPVFDASLSALMNPLSLLAVSDDGALVLASESVVTGNPAPSVAVFNANGVAGRIALGGPASAIAFLSNNHDALLSSAPESALIRDAAAQAGRIELPAVLNGASGVVAASDGATALFVNAQSNAVSIATLTSSGAPPVTLTCNCSPTGITRTAAKSIYRLNEYLGGPITLLDASLNQPRVLVIPPLVVPDNQ
jgi:hypothetical protein